MVFYRITLRRSVIGTPKKTRAVVESLGLRKRGSVVYQPATPSIAGAVAQIKELVNVELSDRAVSKEEQREMRKSNPGFTVERRV